MKRAEALRPLSREHLSALLIAKKLREADDVEQVSAAFLDFWREDGQHHFRVEEEVLLPTWAVHSEVDRAGVSRMLEEHLAIRRQALRLEAGRLTVEEVRELGELVRRWGPVAVVALDAFPGVHCPEDRHSLAGEAGADVRRRRR